MSLALGFFAHLAFQCRSGTQEARNPGEPPQGRGHCAQTPLANRPLNGTTRRSTKKPWPIPLAVPASPPVATWPLHVRVPLPGRQEQVNIRWRLNGLESLSRGHPPDWPTQWRVDSFSGPGKDADESGPPGRLGPSWPSPGWSPAHAGQLPDPDQKPPWPGSNRPAAFPTPRCRG